MTWTREEDLLYNNGRGFPFVIGLLKMPTQGHHSPVVPAHPRVARVTHTARAAGIQQINSEDACTDERRALQQRKRHQGREQGREKRAGPLKRKSLRVETGRKR